MSRPGGEQGQQRANNDSRPPQSRPAENAGGRSGNQFASGRDARPSGGANRGGPSGGANHGGGGNGGGGGVADHLGNHTATQNIVLGSNWLSGDGQNEGLSIDSSGNVGVGTASPSSKLHVEDTVASGAVEVQVQNLSSTSPSSSLRLKNPAQNWAVALRGDTSNVLAFQDDTAGAIRMSIAPTTGYVGIGTHTPADRLDVDGRIRATQYDSWFEQLQTQATMTSGGLLSPPRDNSASVGHPTSMWLLLVAHRRVLLWITNACPAPKVENPNLAYSLSI